jgi:hypothetical protein
MCVQQVAGLAKPSVQSLTANLHPRAYFLEILPMALLLHATILVCLSNSISRKVDRNQRQNSAAKKQGSSHLFLLQ